MAHVVHGRVTLRVLVGSRGPERGAAEPYLFRSFIVVSTAGRAVTRLTGSGQLNARY